MKRRRPVVVKFGGATLSDPAAVVRWVSALRSRHPRVVVVLSAREGVTDLLKSIVAKPRQRGNHRRILASIGRLHPGLPRTGAGSLERLRRLVVQVEQAGRADAPLADRLVSQGERLAVHWMVPKLQRAGLPAVAVEADHLGVLTDNEYGASTILLRRSAGPVRRRLGDRLRAGQLPVVTGFIGRSLEGRVTTLGRGGSDYSATALGAMLGASRIELVKRGVSVLTGDPRRIPASQPIPRLSYEEAEEPAQFGAKVLHPLTVEPARAAGVEIHVIPIGDPASRTVIGRRPAPVGTTALTLLPAVALLRLRVAGGRQRPGVVAEVSRRLAAEDVNIVTLFTSSTVLNVVLEERRSPAGRAALEPLVHEGQMVLDGPHRVGLLTAIGTGVLKDVARLPPELLASAEGLSATPRSVTLALPTAQAQRALLELHRVLVETERK